MKNLIELLKFFKQLSKEEQQRVLLIINSRVGGETK